jgi:hypothetical protein
MRKFVVVLGLCLWSLASMAQPQEYALGGEKIWYSTYINKKINARFSVDNFTLLALRSQKHDFWFFQNNLSVNYRIHRLLKVSAGYGHTFYHHSAWWQRHYDRPANNYGNISFHSFFGSVQRDVILHPALKMSNRFLVQYYIPKYEKYQLRLQYKLRLKYNRSNLPLKMKPFIQTEFYYYLNGVEANYYDADFNVIDFAAPDGLHRQRTKIGLQFKPIKSVRSLSFIAYFGFNREFNIDGLGNVLNFDRPSKSGKTIFTTYPFSNYNILGLQANYFF